MSLFQLFLLFIYIDLSTIGGGLVALSIMQQQLIPRGLVTAEQFYSMVAISESTPGPIGINMATFIGYTLHGVPGALAVTLASIIPSFVITMIIATLARSFGENKIIQKSFYGIRAGATGMIAIAAWSIISITLINLANLRNLFSQQATSVQGLSFSSVLSVINPMQIGFYVLALLGLRYCKKLHPILIVLLGAIFGIVLL